MLLCESEGCRDRSLQEGHGHCGGVGSLSAALGVHAGCWNKLVHDAESLSTVLAVHAGCWDTLVHDEESLSAVLAVHAGYWDKTACDLLVQNKDYQQQTHRDYMHYVKYAHCEVKWRYSELVLGVAGRGMTE